LRKFYEKDGYSLLKKDETLTNLEALASFWVNVAEQDDSVFSEKVLKNLSVLNYAPNGMWAYLTSVYFMQNKDSNGMLEDKSFGEFLDKIIAFIWAYAIMRPGVNALRTPVYPELINIVNNQQVSFNDYKFDESDVKLALENYLFTNGRPITKSMLAWWMYTNDKQDLFLLDTKVEIEHIYAKKGKVREGTKNKELFDLSSNSNDFKETDIIERKNLIICTFIDYLRRNDLLLK